MEIERKYLIKKMPENIEQYEKKEIEQGYLNRKPVLRIRKSNDDYILTYKMKKAPEDGNNNPLINEEIEAELTESAYIHLKEKVDNNIISKTRYIIPYHADDSDYRIEMDVFHGCLEGLVFAEVEFESVEASENFTKPEWFGKDVSGDRRFRNGFLSEQSDLECFKNEENT